MEKCERVGHPPHPPKNQFLGVDVLEWYYPQTWIRQWKNAKGLATRLRGGATDFYDADGLGSITSLTNGAGTLAETYTYDSFGILTNSAGSLTNFFRYTGREFDTEAGIYYYRARYYDTVSGRFASEDPLGTIDGINRYAYTNNSPVDVIDPSGLCPNCPPSSLFTLSPATYEELGRTAGWLGNDINLFNFRRGGALDAQRNGPFTAYANYAFGVYACGAGYSLSTTLTHANTYAYLRSTYHNVPMDLKYKHIPTENAVNITLGFNDCRNGTLCKQ